MVNGASIKSSLIILQSLSHVCNMNRVALVLIGLEELGMGQVELARMLSINYALFSISRILEE